MTTAPTPQGGPVPAQFTPGPTSPDLSQLGAPSFAGDPGLQYIEIRDFSPGIFHSPVTPVRQAVDGAAQLDGTYDCCSSLTGELIPGPRRVFQYSKSALPSTPSKAPEYYPSKEQYIRIEDMRVVSPVAGLALGSEPVLPDVIYIGNSHIYNSSGAGPGASYEQRINVQRYGFQFALTDAAAQAAYESGAQDTLEINLSTSATVATLSSVTVGAVNLDENSRTLGGGAVSIDIGRSNATTSTSAGFPVAAYSIYPFYSTSSSVLGYSPANSAPTTNNVGTLAFGATGSNAPYIVIAHQDRFLGFGQGSVGASSVDFGPSTKVNGEVMRATAVNDADTSASVESIFSNESPYGIGTWVSMNASELLIIKRRGGGYALRGDIENPQIVRLPGIASANPQHRGVMTTQGFVYGNKRGVWLWPGGDTSVCISDQIEGFFWDATPGDSRPIKDKTGTTEVRERRTFFGSFGFSYPYVYVPNNFYYDMRIGSWWRLSQPGKYAYMHYGDSANGNMIAAPCNWDAEDLNMFNWYSHEQGANKYSWKSQPLHRTQSNVLNYREVVLFAQGANAKVELTLEGIDGRTETATFKFDSPDRRICLRQPISIETHDVVVTITAESLDLTEAAPSLTFALGYNTGSRVQQVKD